MCDNFKRTKRHLTIHIITRDYIHVDVHPNMKWLDSISNLKTPFLTKP